MCPRSEAVPKWCGLWFTGSRRRQSVWGSGLRRVPLPLWGPLTSALCPSDPCWPSFPSLRNNTPLLEGSRLCPERLRMSRTTPWAATPEHSRRTGRSTEDEREVLGGLLSKMPKEIWLR